MAAELPVCDEDIFSHDSVLNARAVDDAVRELGPVVWLSRENIVVSGRYEHVAAGLSNWQQFSNRSRPWHDASSVRPEILLTDDPPRHTQVRMIMGRALSPRTLQAMGERFKQIAAAQIDKLMERSGEVVDAVTDIAAPFVHQVLPDVIGMPMVGREHMTAFGHMVWATMGPQNALFHEAMEGSAPILAWADWACSRDQLAEDGLGMEMFRAADRGELTQEEAKLLVLTMLSAGADTTVMTTATALRAFCRFPEQWQVLRADPSLLRAAFDESLRWDSPSRMAGRIAAQDIEIEGYVIPKGTRCGLMFAAANRDPRKWPEPEKFDIRRDLRGHVGWGLGVHACVGRILAQLEADALMGALAERIESFEAAGEPDWWMTTIGHGPWHLPVRFTAAAQQ